MTVAMPTHPQFRDLAGQKFGRLEVSEYAGRCKGHHYWLCSCSCGHIKTIAGDGLKSGAAKSCGCYKRERAQERGRARLIDLIGKKFSRLTVLEYAGNRKGHPSWLCRCKCGKETTVDGGHLKAGNIKSCGCYHDECGKKNGIDLSGKKFGRWTVIERRGSRDHSYRWFCRCGCGTERVVQGASLRQGISLSCGCYKIERTIATKTTHGLSGTSAYRRWRDDIRKGKEHKLDTGWTPEMEQALYEQQTACVLCRSIHPLSVDHVEPISRGHGLYPGNAVILCKSCNSTKSNKPLEDLPAANRRKLLKAAKSFASYWEKHHRAAELV